MASTRLNAHTSCMRVAIYTRVSSNDGQQDVENQTHALRAFSHRNGWEIVREYTDKASGKSAAKRVQFQAMLSDAAQRPFDVVLVWALDRFTREGVGETFDYIKRLVSHGVQFVSFTEEHFRTTGPAGELMLAVAAWIAKAERQRMGERTRAGLERARRNGSTFGRPKLVVDRARVLELGEAGETLVAIAKRLKVSKSSIARMCSAA